MCRRSRLRCRFQIHGDAIALARRDGVQFAFIVKNERAAIGRDDHILRANDGDLTVSCLAIRCAQNTLRDCKLNITRSVRRKAHRAAANRRANYAFSFRKCRGAGTEQVNLRGAEFQAKRSAFVGLYRIAWIHRGSNGEIRIIEQRFARLDDQAEGPSSRGGKRREIEKTSH